MVVSVDVWFSAVTTSTMVRCQTTSLQLRITVCGARPVSTSSAVTSVLPCSASLVCDATLDATSSIPFSTPVMTVSCFAVCVWLQTVIDTGLVSQFCLCASRQITIKFPLVFHESLTLHMGVFKLLNGRVHDTKNLSLLFVFRNSH